MKQPGLAGFTDKKTEAIKASEATWWGRLVAQLQAQGRDVALQFHGR